MWAGEGCLSAVQPDGRMHYTHGRANRAVAGEAARDWDARPLLVVRLQLEAARRAAQPGGPRAGQARARVSRPDSSAGAGPARPGR